MLRPTFVLGSALVPASIATVLLTTAAAKPKAVDLVGVPWYSDASVATQMAQRDRKPLLVLQMMGRLDDAFC